MITRELQEFIAERDSFYLGTASSDGQPYIQHRGGAKGFLKVLDEKTLAVADYAGNAQYISLGNLSERSILAIVTRGTTGFLPMTSWRGGGRST